MQNPLYIFYFLLIILIFVFFIVILAGAYRYTGPSSDVCVVSIEMLLMERCKLLVEMLLNLQVFLLFLIIMLKQLIVD